MKTSIKGFFGEYQWLSNFWPACVTWNELNFPTVEHAFVYAKLKEDPELIEYNKIIKMTPREAKRYGRQINLREGWDDIKVNVMRTLVESKFANSLELQNKLLKLRGAYIEETNTWKDTFWGVCNNRGRNELGHIIMAVRDKLFMESVF